MGLQLGQLPHHVSTVRGRDLVSQIDQHRSNMDDVLKGLSDLSVLDRRAVTPNPEHIELGVALADVLNHYRRKALSRGIGFNVTNEADVVLTDVDLISRVTGYLLCNAVRYTRTGTVSVLFQKGVAGYIQVHISDTGCGVKTEDIGHIFEEFAQLEHEVELGRQGLGLGLSLVERFCDLLDIEVDFRSTPGKGTSVTLLIPRGDPEQLPEKPVVSLVQSFDGLDVLLIEPDEGVREAIASSLSQWGCQVKAAESRWAGLCLLDEGWRPQLVLADNGADDKPMGLAAVVSVWQALDEEVGALILATHTGSLDNETVKAANIQVLKKPASQADIRQAMMRVLPPRPEPELPADVSATNVSEAENEAAAVTAKSSTPTKPNLNAPSVTSDQKKPQANPPRKTPPNKAQAKKQQVSKKAPAKQSATPKVPAKKPIAKAPQSTDQPSTAPRVKTQQLGNQDVNASAPATTTTDTDATPVNIDLHSLKLMKRETVKQPLKERG